MTHDALIDTWKLGKRYRGSKTYALHDLNLHVAPGEVYGLLGPNGAGKSTTIHTLLNFIQPTEGSARLMGLDIVKDSVAIKRSAGYLASDMALYPKMTGGQFLRYMGQLQGGDNTSYRQELIHRLQADPDKKLGSLSRGNRQKFAIIQAFMHKPRVLILDEPSSGLDPIMQEVFYQLLGEAKARGAAVFMSSHIMSEVQKVCDRVGIIRDGELVTERSITDLIREAAHTFEITFASTPPLAELKRVRGVQVAAHDEHQVTVRVQGPLPPLLGVLARHDVTHLDAHQLDLEELFMHFYTSAAEAGKTSLIPDESHATNAKRYTSDTKADKGSRASEEQQ